MKIEKLIDINAAPEQVFDALTNSEHIVQYYPLQKVESDWQLGSEVWYHGESDGKAFTDFGVILAIDNPHKYSYRYWSSNHATENTIENHLVITYEMKALAGHRTRLRLTQENIQSKVMYNLMNDQVWDYLLNGLKQYVETIPDDASKHNQSTDWSHK